MNWKIRLVILLIILAQQCEAKKQSRFSINSSIGIKKQFDYNQKEFINASGLYRIKNKIQPIVAANVSYSLRKNLKLQTGVGYASAKYWVAYEKSGFNQDFGIGTSTLKFPVRVIFSFTPKIDVGLGVALNYQSFSSYAVKSTFSIHDSVEIYYEAIPAGFKDYFTISNQIVFSYKLARKFSLSTMIDVDWGKYPSATFNHDLNNLTTKERSISGFYAKPRMFYVAIELAWQIW